MLRGRTSYAEPEIGYMIRKTRQGQGLATEAASAVLDECRATGIQRVWTTVRPQNTASRHIAQRLGMRAERTEHDDRGTLIGKLAS
jgi:ribosomal-protein-alanine N-acetyltransferase